MKKYPLVNGKPLDEYSRKKMDAMEVVIKNYLDMDNNGKYPNSVLSYNIAFLLLDI